MPNDQAIIEIINIFDNLQKKFTPDKPLMTAIAGHLHASVMQNFANQGKDVPGGWKPLKPSTLRQKRYKGWSERILEAQGNLIRSIQQGATENEAWASTNLRYAAIQHFGGEIFHHPKTRSLAFRLTKKGELMSQEGYPNLVRFAKKSHKNALRYTIAQQSYTVNIPARPFMVLTSSFKDKIIAEIHNHIGG